MKTFEVLVDIEQRFVVEAKDEDDALTKTNDVKPQSEKVVDSHVAEI